MTAKQHIEALRQTLTEQHLSAFIIPSTDPHLSEYVAPHWKSRSWISGFTGSAGTVVVTPDEAGLWTDSRYFLQAEAQLEGSGITLYKEKLPQTPTVTGFLRDRLAPGQCVGIDGNVFSAGLALQMQGELRQSGITLRQVPDPFNAIWPQRPPLPQDPIFALDERYAGMSVPAKLAALRDKLKEQRVQAVMVSALDEIAWTLNLRGSDVAHTPVFIAYLLVTREEACLFTPLHKLSPELTARLREEGVTVRPYHEALASAEAVSGQRVLLPMACTNFRLYEAFGACCDVVPVAGSPIAPLKAVRNSTEMAGVRRAMERDGVALVKWLMWLEEQVGTEQLTEMDAARKLEELRGGQPLFMGSSFGTIAGYAAHGAIVHYEATPETNAPLRPKGFLLVDSGGQYLDGTTDITRTIALGPTTAEERQDYTLVLKGHIQLAMATFPQGTRGAQLDALARMPLWKQRMNYLHGTGHGVGSFLSVHEGPQSIRMEENPVALQAGMVVSNEPGIYKEGLHGVRTENLMLVIPAGQGMFGGYLTFETLTLCPIDTKPVIADRLTREEKEWLNTYHHTVYERLAPHLDNAGKAWLERATRSV